MFNWYKPKQQNGENDYGIGLNNQSLQEMALDVCEVFDDVNYSRLTSLFLIEIAATETKLGRYPDRTKYAGMGITQIDKIGFTDTIKRTPKKRKDLIRNTFGVDLDNTEWVELRHNIKLCFIITRLFLLLRPGKIPSTLRERAEYHKKWYNTSAGKSTPEKFMADVEENLNSRGDIRWT